VIHRLCENIRKNFVRICSETIHEYCNIQIHAYIQLKNSTTIVPYSPDLASRFLVSKAQENIECIQRIQQLSERLVIIACD